MNHDHTQGAHAWSKHMLLMIICCAVPILLVIAVGLVGLSLGPLQPLLPFVAALMCPLMMGGMMWMMLRNNSSNSSDHSSHPNSHQSRQ